MNERVQRRMTRRRFIQLAARGAATTAIGAALGPQIISRAEAAMADNRRRPNILYLLNDHQAFYGHGAYGGVRILRPNFDRLAAGGVEFTRAYCSSPLCGPSRRTTLTGLFPHNHGEIKNDVDYPFDREVYLDILADHGYRNFYFGKWHAGAGAARDHHCEGFSYPGYNNPYTKPEYLDYLKRKGLPEFEVRIRRSFMNSEEEARKVAKERPGAWGSAVPGELFKVHGPWCNPHATGVMTSPEETHEAIFLANLACEQLKKLAGSEKDQPWSMRVDFWGPHPPYFVSQRFLDMYAPDKIPEYPSFRDDLKDKPELYAVEHNYPLHRNGRIIHPNPLPWSEWQKVLAMHYAQITLVDYAGGLVLDTLDRLGMAENTMVIWSTDHGDAVACHGGHFDKSGYMPEEMVRIPMAVRWPGRIPAAHKRPELVSNIDLAPTFLDAAGLSFGRKVDGESLLPLCAADRKKKWRADLMCETHGHHRTQAGRLIVTGRYKYVWNDGDKEELYDLKEDRFELKNLVDSPSRQDTLKDMRERLARWQAGTGDNPSSPDSCYQKLKTKTRPK